MKKYSNDNIFLNNFNDMNDLTRSAYTNNNKRDLPLNNKSTFDRFETDLILNHKEEFETNNTRINSLNDEIIELKNKLKLITQKDEEINKQKCEIESLNKDLQLNQSSLQELKQCQIENKNLKDQIDRLQIQSINVESLESENKLLKEKLIELAKEKKQKDNDNKLIIPSDDLPNLSKEKIPIDIVQFKTVLYNRLKSYHEKHIDNLILSYDLQMKEYIDKDTMEKILLEAIHL
tara:strand:- start:109 stop:810 length:702 start_codon:yes stop_codon:yes gene_type:complete